jgi:hypothetical protein
MAITHSSVGVGSLRLCKAFQSLGLVTHNALNLDDHVASRASRAVDGLAVLNALADLITEIGQLLRGVLGGRVALVAPSTLDLRRDRAALEPARGLDAEFSTRLAARLGVESELTSRSRTDRTHASYHGCPWCSCDLED